jgi:hypothetical protein
VIARTGIGPPLVLVLALGCARSKPVDAPAAPPFPSLDARDWVGQPQSWERLRGKVVVMDVWTFG